MKPTFNFNRPYVRNNWKTFTPIYMPGENYSFYINFSDAPASAFGTCYLNLIDANTNYVVFEFGALSKLFVAGSTGYHLYKNNFLFPDIENGQYYFQITIGVASGAYPEAARSNLIVVDSGCLLTTSYIKFQHNDQLFGVRYDLLPNFFQMFRLPINQIKVVEEKDTRESYREASGQRDIVLSKAFRDEVITFEMSWANQEDFEALGALLLHSNVSINGTCLILLDQVKTEEISPFSEQFKGTFTAIPKDDSPSLGYSADGILCGYGFGLIDYFCGTD